MKKVASWLFLLAVIALGAFVVYYFKDRFFPSVTPSSSPSTQQAASPTVKPGWKVYENKEYGFTLSYPEGYRIVSDTYGWPKAILLLYKGGQSYDLVVEAWDNQSEYQAKYPNQPNLIVKNINGKYLTLLNMNFNPEVDSIIETFTIK